MKYGYTDQHCPASHRVALNSVENDGTLPGHEKIKWTHNERTSPGPTRGRFTWPAPM